MADVGVSLSSGIKLFGREIIFDVFQPVWQSYLNLTDGQTDDFDLLWHNALCVASRGKNQIW